MAAAVAERSSSSSEARRIGASGIGVPLADHGRDVEVTVPILVGEPRRQPVCVSALIGNAESQFRAWERQ